MARRSFQWRGEPYRLDSGTWHFWGQARLIQLPGDTGDFRMTPDHTLFVQFAVKAGFECPENQETLGSCQVYLEQNGHQIWSAREALEIVRDDIDPELSTCLLERLIEWFFVIRC